MTTLVTELTSLTIARAARFIASRQLSPLELTRAYLARIEQLQPLLNCFITILDEPAMRQAREVEEAIQRGEYRGGLHGIPLALKDLIETAGIRTTAGSKFFADFFPQKDSLVWEKLNQAGAILLGKLNMHEIALGVTNNNPHFGACRNPWQTECIPGGSSGGSAAALAAGLCLGALGSDTGGSIRIPAALCGVVGLKPTYGRVSLWGVIPLSWHLDHVGPMARTAEDVAILLQAMAGYDPQDPHCSATPLPNYLSGLQEGLRGWRIALAKDAYFTRCDVEILAAVNQAGKVFSELGADLREVEIQDGREAALTNGLITTCEAAAFHRERMKNQPSDFGEDVLQRLQMGAAFSTADYIQARQTQARLKRQFEHLFQVCDLLITPTTPCVAPLQEGSNAVEQASLLTSFTAPFNLTGLPAISLPCGISSLGLPIGMQIVAPAWEERKLLQAAIAYQQASTWHLRRPHLGDRVRLGS